MVLIFFGVLDLGFATTRFFAFDHLFHSCDSLLYVMGLQNCHSSPTFQFLQTAVLLRYEQGPDRYWLSTLGKAILLGTSSQHRHRSKVRPVETNIRKKTWHRFSCFRTRAVSDIVFIAIGGVSGCSLRYKYFIFL